MLLKNPCEASGLVSYGRGRAMMAAGFPGAPPGRARAREEPGIRSAATENVPSPLAVAQDDLVPHSRHPAPTPLTV